MHHMPEHETVDRRGNPGRAKGTSFLHLRDFVLRYHGPGVWGRVLDSLSQEDQALLEGGSLRVGGWYPVGAWNRVLAAFLFANYTDVEAGMTQLAGYISEKDLNILFRIVLRMGSPEFLLKRAGSMWSRYFDSGTLVHQEIAPRHWRLALDMPVAPEVPDPLTCGPGVAAWITQGLRLTGVDGRAEHVGTQQGPSTMYEFRATW